MYHPGKVLAVVRKGTKEVLSADKTSQAVLEMWDENQLTFSVAGEIARQIKIGDVVLVDYTQEERGNAIVPRHLVVKVLRGSTAKEVWSAYKVYHKKRHGSRTTSDGEKPNGDKPESVMPRYFG